MSKIYNDQLLIKTVEELQLELNLKQNELSKKKKEINDIETSLVGIKEIIKIKLNKIK